MSAPSPSRSPTSADKTFQILGSGRIRTTRRFPVSQQRSCAARSKKAPKRSNTSVFLCNQWRRVLSVPSGFSELGDVAEMRGKQPSNLRRSILFIF
jgi:hypothetical protein